MFGYVTPEDRSKWEQNRAQNKPRVNALKVAMQSAAGAVMEFGQRNMDAKLKAAHQVVAREQFEESHDKTVTKRQNPRTGAVTETVDYQPKNRQDEMELDFG